VRKPDGIVDERQTDAIKWSVQPRVRAYLVTVMTEVRRTVQGQRYSRTLNE